MTAENTASKNTSRTSTSKVGEKSDTKPDETTAQAQPPTGVVNETDTDRLVRGTVPEPNLAPALVDSSATQAAIDPDTHRAVFGGSGCPEEDASVPKTSKSPDSPNESPEIALASGPAVGHDSNTELAKAASKRAAAEGVRPDQEPRDRQTQAKRTTN